MTQDSPIQSLDNYLESLAGIFETYAQDSRNLFDTDSECIAVAELCGQAFSLALIIQRQILGTSSSSDPFHSSSGWPGVVTDENRRHKLAHSFRWLDIRLCEARPHIENCWDTYQRLAAVDTPIGDWCGLWGDPITIAYGHARRVCDNLRQTLLTDAADAAERQSIENRSEPISSELLASRLPEDCPDPSTLGQVPATHQVSELCERLHRLRAQLDEDDKQWFPASWYDTNYGLTAETLRQAAHRGNIPSRNTPGRSGSRAHNQYPLDDVRRQWPEKFEDE